MGNQELKNQLKTIYTSLHKYTYNILAELNENEYMWRPADTKARTIFSYSRHIVNTELYWLHALKKHDLEYAGPKTPFSRIIQQFKNSENEYLELLENATENDFEIQSTSYNESPETGEIISIEQKGTLAWTVLRISLHAFGHMSQITHMLYSQGITPKKDPENNWWNITENIINLGKLMN
jgi:uncharacterized damage-inducible protein DinB